MTPAARPNLLVIADLPLGNAGFERRGLARTVARQGFRAQSRSFLKKNQKLLSVQGRI
jgi:hypothetical protein